MKTQDQSHHTLSNVLLVLGISIALICLLYMIFNLDKADEIIGIWFPFMIISSMMVFWSWVLKRGK